MDKLISAYLIGGLDDDSLQELKQWIMASSENERYFMQRQEAWFAALSTRKDTLYDKDKAFELFKSRVSADKVRKTLEEEKVVSHWQKKLFSVFRYAAAVVVLCVVATFFYWKGEEKMKGHFADIVVEAPMGSRTKLYLPDGTLVWLNAGSRLSYSQGFGVEERSVKMFGEAYFEVMRNEDLPFSVYTNDLRVRVLGTKFNFRDYPEDNEVIVSLLEGKVALDNLVKKGEEICLFPNDRAVLDKKSGKIQLERAVATNAVQWTNGYLFFDEELLPDIVDELERSYGVRIEIKNEELNTFRFYGNFVRREQSINEVLEALAATGKVRYEIRETCIVLY